MDMAQNPKKIRNYRKYSLGVLGRDMRANKFIYIMVLPVIAYYIIFHYVPMYGAIIAFKDFVPKKGVFGSPWVGIDNFREFFGSYFFKRIFRNTLLISLYTLLYGFPAPILMALLLNEIKNRIIRSTIQTATYMPHFISLVVVCGIIVDFTSTNGILTRLSAYMGGSGKNLLMQPSLFRTIYVGSGIWQHLGWNSIIYLAALSGINPNLYEAATIDGAGRFRQAIHVTLPGIMPTIVILLILQMGRIMSVGFEKIILLYNPTTYETGDVISSFVYRKGLLEFDFSYSTAVGLFNSVINCILLVTANQVSRSVNETSLW